MDTCINGFAEQFMVLSLGILFNTLNENDAIRAKGLVKYIWLHLMLQAMYEINDTINHS